MHTLVATHFESNENDCSFELGAIRKRFYHVQMLRRVPMATCGRFRSLTVTVTIEKFPPTNSFGTDTPIEQGVGTFWNSYDDRNDSDRSRKKLMKGRY